MRESIWNLIGCCALSVVLLGCNGTSDTPSTDGASQDSDSGVSADDSEATSETEKIKNDIPIPNLNETSPKPKSGQPEASIHEDASDSN